MTIPAHRIAFGDHLRELRRDRGWPSQPVAARPDFNEMLQCRGKGSRPTATRSGRLRRVARVLVVPISKGVMLGLLSGPERRHPLHDWNADRAARDDQSTTWPTSEARRTETLRPCVLYWV
ncbi:MAG: hypothetical protein K0S70_893 [Microbacterium sp.]|jgi:hypothetical protein|nr:hypothetical protein [Microbacterium sp.]